MTREDAIHIIKSECYVFNPLNFDRSTMVNTALDMAVKALEQETILDKIRAEIEELHLIGYATVDGKREIASRAVMQIIDKYKAEKARKNNNG